MSKKGTKIISANYGMNLSAKAFQNIFEGIREANKENRDIKGGDEYDNDNKSVTAPFDDISERELSVCEGERELNHSLQAAASPCSSSASPYVDVNRQW
jgi:hypothetical protein